MDPLPEVIMTELITQVNALLKEVAAKSILPRYQALHSDQIKGVLYASKFAPPEIAEQVDKTRHLVNEEIPLYCSAWEYMRLCFNEMGFCLFTRLMPWDHAPGSLIYTEAGGISRCIDGEDYKAADFDKKGLLLAPDEASWNILYHTLFGD